jgi:hypothetical protein
MSSLEKSSGEIYMDVDSVSKLLQADGRFRRASQPLRVQDLEFQGDFDAVLEGPNAEHGLVLVVDGTNLTHGDIEGRVMALSSALTRTGSMRPTTLILISPRPPEDAWLAELQALSRVIVISGEQDAKESLRSMLRLKLLPTQSGFSEDNRLKSAEDVLCEEMGGKVTDPFLADLIEAALKSSSDVERKVRETIDHAAKLESPTRGRHD